MSNIPWRHKGIQITEIQSLPIIVKIPVPVFPDTGIYFLFRCCMSPSTPLYPILLTNNYPPVPHRASFFLPNCASLLIIYTPFLALFFSICATLYTLSFQFSLRSNLLFRLSCKAPFPFSFSPFPHLYGRFRPESEAFAPLPAKGLFLAYRPMYTAGTRKKPCTRQIRPVQGLGWVYSFFILCALEAQIKEMGLKLREMAEVKRIKRIQPKRTCAP